MPWLMNGLAEALWIYDVCQTLFAENRGLNDDIIDFLAGVDLVKKIRRWEGRAWHLWTLLPRNNILSRTTVRGSALFRPAAGRATEELRVGGPPKKQYKWPLIQSFTRD